MILVRVMQAAELESAEERVIGVDVLVRVYYDDLDDLKDLRELTGQIGQGTVGLHVEDGRGRPVLQLKKPRKAGSRGKSKSPKGHRLDVSGLDAAGSNAGENVRGPPLVSE